MSCDTFLPPGRSRHDFAAIVGLLSDTHMPLRRRALPETLAGVMQGVDLLLHAGDVGELWVLDQLSEIAPVIAVHGNDDTVDAQRELPYQQIVTVAGVRILLWHSHFPIREVEMAFRRDDDLNRSIARSVARGRSAGAGLVVFGHWHIPLVYTGGEDDLTVINPGALAPGNELSRMTHTTVALAYIEPSGAIHLCHVDLAAPDRVYTPVIDWNAGFVAAMQQFSASILTPELEQLMPRLRAACSVEEILAIRPYICALAHPIWEGDIDRRLGVVEMQTVIRQVGEQVSPELGARLQRLMDAGG